jgi:hypothetical protein
VLALLVRLPFATRRWALPLLMALYRPEEENSREKRRHKTPPELLRQLLLVVMRWFPDRRFVGTADGNYATHELAELASRYRRRLTFVSKFYPDANLFEPPPPVLGKRPSHRPRKKGAKQPAPEQVVRDTPKRQRLDVAWYGGGRRQVDVVVGNGCWYRGGRPLVPVRWVFVHDRTGTHREEYFFTTDPAMDIDAWGWDGPLDRQVKEALARQEPGVFWAAHQADLPYSQIERLVNLGSLPTFGFKVACFHLKIMGGSAGPTRAVAIVPD